METMRLRYLGEGERLIKWRHRRVGYPHSTMFNPEADVPADLGKRLLANSDPRVKGKFVRVEAPQATHEEPKSDLACDVCEFVAKSEAGLGSHKRKHKEKQE